MVNKTNKRDSKRTSKRSSNHSMLNIKNTSKFKISKQVSYNIIHK